MFMKRITSLLLLLAVLLCGCSVMDEASVTGESNVIADEQEVLNDDAKSEETVPGTPIDPESLLPDEEDSSAAEIPLEEEVPVEDEETEVAEENVSVTVYRTKSGKKYHYDGCYHLKSKIETTVDEARAMGLKPCSVCNPPS